MTNHTEQNAQTQSMRDTPPNASKSTTENCLPIGTRLAEFEVTGMIGEGGFGTVYLAMDLALQRTVAIKEYMPSALASRGADKSVLVRSQRHQDTFDIGLKSFINEARLLAQFDHPALIKVHRFWEENRTGYMAMRYYEGQTLKSLVKKTPDIITEAWLKSMLKPVLDALDALYKVQILHRDVSPDNIMIQTTGEAVLLDFGAARQIIGDATQALTVILKPGYAPIEQYADDASLKQGAWTDIYALSAVIYYCIVKKPPTTSVARMIKDPIIPLHTQAPAGYSQQFLAAIDRGLRVKADERPQSIAEFRQLLGISTEVASTPHTTPLAPAQGIKSEERTSDVEKKIADIRSRANDKNDPIVPSSGSGQTRRVRKNLRTAFLTATILTLMIATATLVTTKIKKVAVPRPSAITTAPVIVPQQAVEESHIAVPVTADEETTEWNALNSNTDVTQSELRTFIQKYPSGNYSEVARLKMEGLAPPAMPAAPAESTVVVAPKAMGTITLHITPWGKVTVDGISKGASPPLKKLLVTEGKHRIKISNPGFPDSVTEIDVTKNSTGTINHEFSTNAN